jgi:hypothetical protein
MTESLECLLGPQRPRWTSFPAVRGSLAWFTQRRAVVRYVIVAVVDDKIVKKPKQL